MVIVELRSAHLSASRWAFRITNKEIHQMNYTTAVHEAGHAVAAESLGMDWTLVRGTAATEYLAKVTVDQGDNWQFENRVFIDLCGPYAVMALTGEPVSEDYHWQFISHMSIEAKAAYEDQAEAFVFDNWTRIIELADEFVGDEA